MRVTQNNLNRRLTTFICQLCTNKSTFIYVKEKKHKGKTWHVIFFNAYGCIKKMRSNIVICLLNQIQWKLCVYMHRYLILIIAIVMRKLFSVLSVVVRSVIMITNNVVFNETDTYYYSEDCCLHNETSVCHFICNWAVLFEP